MRDLEYDTGEPFVVIEKESGHLPSFVWGLAVGAGLALLFAPQSGARTRREIQRRARRAQRAATSAAGELSESVVDRYETARRTVEDKLSTARQAIDLKRQQAQRAIRAGREAAQDAREELERRISETKAAYQAGADVAHESRATARSAAAPSRRGAVTGGGAAAGGSGAAGKPSSGTSGTGGSAGTVGTAGAGSDAVGTPGGT